VSRVLEALRGRRFDSVSSVFVLDASRRLLGAIPLADLYAAPEHLLVGRLMESHPASVRDDVDREDAASLAIREDLVVVPVVDSGHRFLGVFPAREIMGVLRAEHVEDLHHLAGIWHQSDAARQALQAPPFRRARYRLPWLIIGLAGSMVATVLVAHFENLLQSEIVIAFFVPAIVYLADAVGTQSEAVAVRGLSLTQFGIGRLLTGEIAAGALMGLVLGALAGAFALVAFGRTGLALAVSLSLLGACTIATAMGLVLPWAFARAGWDPAFASGPVGTILQDVLSLTIYFWAASSFV
jgi:magnesium transporter